VRLLVTFHSVSEALLFEAAGKARGFFCVLIPSPRALSSSCGYAAETEAETAESLSALLSEINVNWEALWRQSGGGYTALLRNEP
jgi:hypothetical protein